MQEKKHSSIIDRYMTQDGLFVRDTTTTTVKSVAMTDPKGHYYSRGATIAKEVYEEATKGCIRSKLTKLCLQALAPIIQYQRNSTGQYDTPRLVPISSFLGHIKKKNSTWTTNRIQDTKMFNFWCESFEVSYALFHGNFF
jgi:hypothetical protein